MLYLGLMLNLGLFPERLSLLEAPRTTNDLHKGCSTERSESSAASPRPRVRLCRS